MRAAIITATAILLASTSLALACGKERWPVKVGTDQDAGQVVTTAQASTVAALRAITVPAIQPDRRAAPVETTVFAISGILTVIKRESDEDYHLVIADPDIGGTMIVESPNPHCAEGSQFFNDIASARQTIDDKFGPIGRKRQPNIPVTVVGVGFFDFIHHPPQEGVAPNGIELHPILHIQFN